MLKVIDPDKIKYYALFDENGKKTPLAHKENIERALMSEIPEIECLKKELTKANEEREKLNAKNEVLLKDCEKKDLEIERLKGMVEAFKFAISKRGDGE